jgi:hypothetical protein
MTPSKYIKSQGLPSTAYVADKVSKPAQTINNWYHNNFALFEVVVAGVVAKEQATTDYTVKCRCGWLGPVSHLTPDRKCGECGAQFHAALTLYERKER